MARRRGAFATQPPREVTLVIAAVLWVIGFADVIMGAFTLPSNLGIWFLVIAGLLLILGSLIDGL
jgi:hypothetical protein